MLIKVVGDNKRERILGPYKIGKYLIVNLASFREKVKERYGF